jgi:hypothetical protein
MLPRLKDASMPKVVLHRLSPLIGWLGLGLAFGLGLSWLARVAMHPPEPIPDSGSVLHLVARDPEPGALASATGEIRLVFNRPIDPASAESHWAIAPAVDGQLVIDGKTLRFVPQAAFAPGTLVRAALSIGTRSVDGLSLDQPVTWSFSVRTPGIGYLTPSLSPYRLVRADQDGNRLEPLPPWAAAIREFAVSPGGDQVAFVSASPEGGEDVWTAVLADGSALRRTDCGAQDCHAPVWLPDRRHLAYTRIGAEGDSRVWILDLDTGAVDLLLGDPTLQAEQPRWSPDGSRVAFQDVAARAMRIHDLQTGHDYAFHTLNGLVGSWSPDGSRMLANVLDISQEPPTGVLYMIQAAGGEANPVYVPGLADFGNPVWSPDGKWVAITAAGASGGLARGLWLLNPDSGETIPVASQAMTAFGAAAWDPQGKTLLFQGAILGSSGSTPSVYLWGLGQPSATLLAEDAFAPAWFP